MKDMSNQDDLLIDISLLNNGVYPFFCGAHKATKPWLLPDKSIATCIESKEYKTYIGKIENGFVQYFTHYQDPLLSIAQKSIMNARIASLTAPVRVDVPFGISGGRQNTRALGVQSSKEVLELCSSCPYVWRIQHGMEAGEDRLIRGKWTRLF